MKTTELEAGRRYTVTETYWRSNSDYQEDTFVVEAREGKKGIELYTEDGGRFYRGINSTYEFKPIDL